MAQVVITAGSANAIAAATTLAISVPEALAGETQAVVVAAQQGSVSCTITGFTLDASSDLDSWPNRLRRFIRVGANAAGSVNVVFGANVDARAYSYSASGLPGNRERNAASQSTYALDPVVPTITGETDCVVVYEAASGSYGRAFTAPAGATELHDSNGYAPVGFVSLTVGYKNGVAGANSLGTVDSTTGDGGDGGDYWRINAITYVPASTPTYSVLGNATVAFVYAPSNVVASATASLMSLAWNDTNTDETAYQTRHRLGTGAWTEHDTISPVLLAYTWGPTAPSTEYTLGVRAIRGADASPWVDRLVTTPASTTALAAPSNLTVQAVSATSATLAWQSNSVNHLFFEVYGNKSGDVEELFLITDDPSQVQITINFLDPNSIYQFRVRAAALQERSSFSASVTLTTSGVVSGPSISSPNIDLIDPCCKVARNRALKGRC